jgi:hypothetical protein
MNHMIHIAAISQIPLDTDGRTNYRRKRAEDKKPLEAIRCPKRRTTDAIFRQLLEDANAAGRHGPGRALRGDSRIQCGQVPAEGPTFAPRRGRRTATAALRVARAAR